MKKVKFDWRARLRSPGVYAALSGVVILFVNRYAPLEVEFVTDLLDLLGVLLIGAGAAVDPSTPGVGDKEK